MIQANHVVAYYGAKARETDDRLNRMTIPNGNLAAPYRAMGKYYSSMLMREVVRSISPETIPKLPIPVEPR